MGAYFFALAQNCGTRCSWGSILRLRSWVSDLREDDLGVAGSPAGREGLRIIVLTGVPRLRHNRIINVFTTSCHVPRPRIDPPLQSLKIGSNEQVRAKLIS